VATFLSEEWFESLRAALREAGPVPVTSDDSVFRVVLEFTGTPSTLPHALTFIMESGGASVALGDHLFADALIRLSYEDALALSTGTLESASALREGRVKVRGDVNAIVPLLSWLQLAHPHAES